MKLFIFILLLSLLPTLALADIPTPEMVQVINALNNTPEVAKKLKSRNATTLAEYSIKSADGINTYVLNFKNRPCRCLPSKALVKIFEDMRPTYHDGAPIYTSSVE